MWPMFAWRWFTWQSGCNDDHGIQSQWSWASHPGFSHIYLAHTSTSFIHSNLNDPMYECLLAWLLYKYPFSFTCLWDCFWPPCVALGSSSWTISPVLSILTIVMLQVHQLENEMYIYSMRNVYTTMHLDRYTPTISGKMWRLYFVSPWAHTTSQLPVWLFERRIDVCMVNCISVRTKVWFLHNRFINIGKIIIQQNGPKKSAYFLSQGKSPRRHMIYEYRLKNENLYFHYVFGSLNYMRRVELLRWNIIMIMIVRLRDNNEFNYPFAQFPAGIRSP